MTVHICDKCGREMGVWLEIGTTIRSLNPQTNIAPFLQYDNKTKELCYTCAESLFENFINRPEKREVFTPWL